MRREKIKARKAALFGKAEALENTANESSDNECDDDAVETATKRASKVVSGRRASRKNEKNVLRRASSWRLLGVKKRSLASTGRTASTRSFGWSGLRAHKQIFKLFGELGQAIAN